VLLCAACGQPAAPEPPAPRPGAAAASGNVPAATASASSSPVASVAFDARWAACLPAEPLLYVAVRNLDFYAPAPGSADEAASMAGVRQRLAAAPGAASFADWLQELNDYLLLHKLAQVSFLELLSGGFALATERPSEQAEPELTLVAPATPKLRAFLEAFEKDAAKGKEVTSKPLAGGRLVVMRCQDRQAAFAFLAGPELILAGSDPARVEAALARAASGGPSIATAPGYRDAVAKLHPDSVVLAVIEPGRVAASLEAAARRAESAPSQPPQGPPDPAALAAQLLKGLNPSRHLAELFGKLKSLSVQYVPGDALSHVDVRAGFGAGAPLPALVTRQLPEKPLEAPGMVSANHPIFLGLSLAAPGDEAANDPAAVQRAETWAQTRGSAAAMLGLSYENDVAPWIGSECSLTVLWDAKLPQVALLAGVRDEEACRRAMLRVAANFKGKLAFQERTVAGAKILVSALPDRPQVKPSYAVTGGFLLVATGPEVLESLLDSPQKLRDSPGFASLFSVMGGNRLQLVGYGAAELMVRLAEMTGGDFEALAVKVQAACLKNLADLRAGKLAVAQALCPAAGKYTEGPKAACSIHGTPEAPLPLPTANPQVEAARKLSSTVASMAFGAGMTEPDTFRLSLVFRKRK
jgi:hypothetical protein